MEVEVQLRVFPGICTVQQLAAELKQPTSLINARKRDMLDVCYPFPFVDQITGKKKKGPVFIVMNEKYEIFHERYNRS